MTQGIRKNEPDAKIIYADIINLPHWHVSGKEYMSIYNRSAQFSSFNALTGYEDMVNEEIRETDSFSEMTETEISILNQKLAFISDEIENGVYPVVKIRYFVADRYKKGGAYAEIVSKIRRIDSINRQLELFHKTGLSDSYMRIAMDLVREINILK